MSYGLAFTNNDSTVILDSEFARLVIVQQGTWSGTGAGVGVAFTVPVTTAEPPLVFVRPAQSNVFCFCKILGTPGNWTGFSFVGITGQATSGSWFSGVFKSQPLEDYGLRLWDAASTLLFDSGTPVAQFTRILSSWQYLGSVPTSQGVSMLSWTAPSPLNTGDFMLLNNIAMDMAGITSRQGNMYAYWEYNNNRLVIKAVGVDLPIAFYMPVVFAKAPA
jgi:hypothetical protein